MTQRWEAHSEDYHLSSVLKFERNIDKEVQTSYSGGIVFMYIPATKLVSALCSSKVTNMKQKLLESFFRKDKLTVIVPDSSCECLQKGKYSYLP